MGEIQHRRTDQLEAGLDHILASPCDEGTLEMVVCRPATDVREVLTEGRLDPDSGLLGDGWKNRKSFTTDDGSSLREEQICLLNARVIDLVAGSRDRWPLAGDQLIVDLDLGEENLAPGTCLEIGEAVLEVNDLPHHACRKFASRFGKDAKNFINAKEFRAFRFRGVKARVIRPGSVRPGDTVRKVDR